MARGFASLPGPLNAGRALIAFGVLVVGLIWAAIAWDLRMERARGIGAARADTANLARAFEEHVLRTVAGLDQTLLYLKQEYENAPVDFDIGRSIANSVILRRVSVQIARIGADGILADSNVANFARVDLSDREHFRVHRDGGGDRLFISKPVLGRASGKWSVQLTRRLDTPEGGFAGVLVLSLDPGYLSDFYASFDIGTSGAVTLVGRDGVVRAGSAGGAMMGERITDTALLDRVFAEGVGTLDGPAPLDGVRRIASFRAIQGLPLAVIVGRAERDVMAAYDESLRTYLLVGLGLTAVLVAAIITLYTLVRRQECIAGDLAEKKAELLESRERLKRYVADLERIAEVSAHDLQEPLRRMVAYAQLLAQHAESVLDEEGRGYVRQVVEGAQRVRKLVKDLEAFVAVDHLPPAQGLVAADAALAAARRALADTIDGAGATVVVNALPHVAADLRSLTEVFTQLIENAVRYADPARKPLIEVSARCEGGVASISVRDNGVGIQRRHWTRIFEIFHRVHGVDDNPGTGIGLAVVRRIVERLGGKIWLESVPGEGSCFSFTLPTAVRAVPGEDLGQEVHDAA